MFNFLGGLWSSALSWIGSLVTGVVSSVLGFLGGVLNFVWALLGGIWYLLTSIVGIVVLSVEVVGELFHVLFALGVGMSNTFYSLIAWGPDPTWTSGVFASAVSQAVAILDGFGFDVVGWVVAGLIWLLGGWAVVAIMRS